MTEQELINEIYTKSNAFAMLTGLHAANVAYIPKKYYPLCVSKSWGQVNGKLILMNDITVFFKSFKNDIIFVNYMANPSDEMINIPQPFDTTKQRSFIKIGHTRLDVADITSYQVQETPRHEIDQLCIKLRYKKDIIYITDTKEKIKNTIEILDRYVDAKIVL